VIHERLSAFSVTIQAQSPPLELKSGPAPYFSIVERSGKHQAHIEKYSAPKKPVIARSEVSH